MPGRSPARCARPATRTDARGTSQRASEDLSREDGGGIHRGRHDRRRTRRADAGCRVLPAWTNPTLTPASCDILRRWSWQGGKPFFGWRSGPCSRPVPARLTRRPAEPAGMPRRRIGRFWTGPLPTCAAPTRRPTPLRLSVPLTRHVGSCKSVRTTGAWIAWRAASRTRTASPAQPACTTTSARHARSWTPAFTEWDRRRRGCPAAPRR